MLVNFFSFSKRENSTKQVPLSDPTRTDVQCQLKDDCDFVNPVLVISPDILPGTFTPTAFTYCSIPYWQRFYFVKNWRYKKPVWEVELTVDVMASFKAQIGQTTTYIERAAAAYDGTIIDSYYPAKNQYQISYTTLADSWYGVSLSGGSYVMGILNYQTSNRIGSVSYYALTPSQMNQIIAFLYSDSIFNSSSISEIGEGLWKSMFNPFQYVVSCIWFPFKIESFGSTQTDVKVGYWSTGINAIMVTSIAEKTYVTGTLPTHPQSGSRGAYLNYSPFTRHTLYIPPFGSIPIDTSFRSLGNYLYSAVFIDHLTGQATLRVALCQDRNHVNEYNIMTERTAMLGVPIQIAQIMVDANQTISGAGQILGGIASLNLGGIINGIANAVDSQMPKVSTMGANGSFVSNIAIPTIVSEFANIVDGDDTEMGRPLCQVRQINSLTGFIKTVQTDHAFNCTATERNMINSYMKNGFFYE